MTDIQEEWLSETHTGFISLCYWGSNIGNGDDGRDLGLHSAGGSVSLGDSLTTLGDGGRLRADLSKMVSVEDS